MALWHARHLQSQADRSSVEKSARRTGSACGQRTAELDQRNRQLARLTSELTLAEQRERRRLAEVLQDHLQQQLAGARLNLEMACAEAAPDAAVRTAYDLVTHSLETSRTLSAELSPPVLYLHGLTEAFKWLSRWMEKTQNLCVDLHVGLKTDPAQEELKILLFQSVRELLFNVVKHAGTNRRSPRWLRR
jgi:two-component system CheB/CheR fusion protein